MVRVQLANSSELPIIACVAPVAFWNHPVLTQLFMSMLLARKIALSERQSMSVE